MIRFLTLTLFLMVAFGSILHFKMEVPGISSWIGRLPGDLILTKGEAVIYLPITTSILVSIVVSLLLGSFSSKKEN